MMGMHLIPTSLHPMTIITSAGIATSTSDGLCLLHKFKHVHQRAEHGVRSCSSGVRSGILSSGHVSRSRSPDVVGFWEIRRLLRKLLSPGTPRLPQHLQHTRPLPHTEWVLKSGSRGYGSRRLGADTRMLAHANGGVQAAGIRGSSASRATATSALPSPSCRFTCGAASRIHEYVPQTLKSRRTSEP